MPTTVTLTPDDLPDCTATLHDDGSYEFAITGLTGLTERAPTVKQHDRDRGILSFDPPTVRTDDLHKIELLMLYAVERRCPEGLLDNADGVPGAVDKEQLLLIWIVRIWRRLLWQLVPPT